MLKDKPLFTRKLALRLGDRGDMTEADYMRKLEELDRLLNDPDVPMEPGKIWSLLAEIAQRDLGAAGRAQVPNQGL